MAKFRRIPLNYKLGGQEIEVRIVEKCDNDALGICSLGGGYMEIAKVIHKNKEQSEGSKINTFYHELTHSILDTMGEEELSKNERFVCSFAGFLADAMENARFITTKDDK